MTPERWQRIDEVFQGAMDLPPGQRGAYLDHQCADDADLRAQVDSLLAADGSDLIQAAVGAAAASWSTGEGDSVQVLEGQTIGPYRVIERLGQGGMGVVYRAVRGGEEFHQEVALKILRRELVHSEATGRFLSERRILATLEHPFIARLIDGGAHEGRPYLVMEYAQDGLPIDEYCRQRQVSTRDRLDLFLKVCEAVAYAHHRLIVHRDLKPGNIFVLPDGRPKLLDFGIARLLVDDADRSAAAGLTRTGWLLMTPDYASPEQVTGGEISVASDVYSLGVVLYELLTGERPYRLKSHAPGEIQEVVCTRPAPTPSSVVTQASRLRRALEGDLDNIMLMALRKEPERRYASVEQMAGDLRRHLAGQTVMARPDTFSYRSGKFLRRHRIAAVLCAALVASMVAGGFLTFRAGLRAQRRFQQVRSLASSILTDFDPEARRLPGSVKLRQMMVDQSLAYLDTLGAEAGEDDGLKADSAAAYHRIGDILGYPRIPNLGRLQEGLEYHEKAIRMEEEVRRRQGGNPKLLRELALGYAHVGEIQLRMGDAARAAGSLRQAMALSSADDPATYLNIRLNWYRLLFFGGDLQGAQQVVQEAIPLARTLDDPALAATLYYYACQSALGLGRAPEALAAADAGLRFLEGKRAGFGGDTSFRRREAALLEMRAGALGGAEYPNQMRHCEAASLYRRVEAMERPEIGGDLANRNREAELAGTALELAGAVALCGREDATPVVLEAMKTVSVNGRAAQPEFTTALALAHWKRGNSADALRLLAPLLSGDAAEPAALEMAAGIHLETHRTALGLELLRQARRLRGRELSASDFRRVTRGFEQAGNLALAIQNGDPDPSLAVELRRMVAAWPAQGLSQSLDRIRAVAQNK